MSGRLILVLGAKRSGTTWLGNILNSSPISWYCHEPISKLPNARLTSLVDHVKSGGRLASAERDDLLWNWSRAYPMTCRPPFFRKHFLKSPASVRWAAWLAVRSSGCGYSAFRRLFSPSPHADFDLVVKESVSGYAGRLASELRPAAVIVLLRHPWWVISSLREGQKLGLMEEYSRQSWLADHAEPARALGYSQADVQTMNNAEFEALSWLVECSLYERVAAEHANAQTVVYRDLCASPLPAVEQMFRRLGWQLTLQTREFLAVTTGSRPAGWLSRYSAAHGYFSVYRPRATSLDLSQLNLSAEERSQILNIAWPIVERYWPESIDAIGRSYGASRVGQGCSPATVSVCGCGSDEQPQPGAAVPQRPKGEGAERRGVRPLQTY